jgi:hypothetical protein
MLRPRDTTLRPRDTMVHRPTTLRRGDTIVHRPTMLRARDTTTTTRPNHSVILALLTVLTMRVPELGRWNAFVTTRRRDRAAVS